MNTSSDNFQSYAEYARRSLLRLRIVKGLGEELMIQIIIRGITDAQIKAVVSNSNLTVENVVSFLANYTKPKFNVKSDNHKPFIPTIHKNKSRNSGSDQKCFGCGKPGHTEVNCRTPAQQHANTRDSGSRTTCTFCKKVGHKEDVCFTKSKSLTQGTNRRNINLCKELPN
ncbi:Retrovirus-related Gag polyprotein [Papilio xuthus]|uniref:Retrovirus-related Gag polyprotein n=1 Tax=Papilio xuthus TaxID=66420 RepID=A0A0N1PEM7_PAPXU|nr:Retrovirus-related Gag polyprotein [Papilio xuthus]